MTFSKRLVMTALAVSAAVVPVRAQEVFQPGKDVTFPTVIMQVKPDYTPEAQAARIEGSVVLEVVVLADGQVGDVTVQQSLDSKLGLDQEAVKAAKQWTFKPGTKDGKPVAVRVHLEMTFRLK
jgi:TonB family protein